MEYSIDFAERLIDAADSFFESPSDKNDAGRAVLYLSLLSCEISLKSLLESAGFTPDELKRRSHNLNGLLTDVCHCEIPDSRLGNFNSAAGLLAVQPISEAPNATVGKVLDAERDGASRYPNEVRYGDLIKHYSAPHVLDCAKAVSKWVRANMDSIRKRSE
ncbi:MAG: hypothetical protein WD397_17080 [Wenzhouxiangellaceae bacterium]